MLVTPVLEHRTPQPYVAIPAHLHREELADRVPPLLVELNEWIESHGFAPGGPPFVRYVVVNYNNDMLEIEVGAPVTSIVSGDERVKGGVLPGGQYATLIHRGPYTRLVDTTAELLAWGRANRIAW